MYASRLSTVLIHFKISKRKERSISTPGDYDIVEY